MIFQKFFQIISEVEGKGREIHLSTALNFSKPNLYIVIFIWKCGSAPPLLSIAAATGAIAARPKPVKRDAALQGRAFGESG
jgi:hypothetical protein